MKVLNIQQAKTHLSRLVEQAMAGEAIVIAKAGRPCVQLVPCARQDEPRKLGGWQGKVEIAADFDAPVPEIIAAFEGEVTPKRRAIARRAKR